MKQMTSAIISRESENQIKPNQIEGGIGAGRELSGVRQSKITSPVAQLVEHRAAAQEVVSSTPAGPTRGSLNN